MEWAVRGSLNCPELFTEIGGSSDQPNWFECIFLSSSPGDHARQLVVVTDGWGRQNPCRFFLVT